MELDTLAKANAINNRIREVDSLIEQSNANPDNTSITPLVLQMGLANSINFAIIKEDSIDSATTIDKLNTEMYNSIVNLLVSYRDELSKVLASM